MVNLISLYRLSFLFTIVFDLLKTKYRTSIDNNYSSVEQIVSDNKRESKNAASNLDDTSRIVAEHIKLLT